VTITSTSGVPNKPSAGSLRQYSTAQYDHQGRTHPTQACLTEQQGQGDIEHHDFKPAP
jgi:hypothetical protein